MRCSPVMALAVLSLLGYSAAAHADTLRCQTLNGNTNCSGSNGVSCQTINGQKTCVSGHGDVVQSIGNGHAADMMDDEDLHDVPAVQRWLERHGMPPRPANPGSDKND